MFLTSSLVEPILKVRNNFFKLSFGIFSIESKVLRVVVSSSNRTESMICSSIAIFESSMISFLRANSWEERNQYLSIIGFDNIIIVPYAHIYKKKGFL